MLLLSTGRASIANVGLHTVCQSVLACRQPYRFGGNDFRSWYHDGHEREMSIPKGENSTKTESSTTHPISSTDTPTSTPPSSEFRKNAIGIQMLSANLHRQLFGDRQSEVTDLDQIEAHLTQHKLWGCSADRVPDVSLDMPPLLGPTLTDHMKFIGTQIAEPYLSQALRFAAAAYPTAMSAEWPRYPTLMHSKATQDTTALNTSTTMPDTPDPIVSVARQLFPSVAQWPQHQHRDPTAVLPPLPTVWSHQQGWTRYGRDGTITPVAYPDESDGALVFDVEVCVREGPYPTLAVAASLTAWYAWLSPRLAHAVSLLQGERSDPLPSIHDDPQRQHCTLIPLGNLRRPRSTTSSLTVGAPRLIIGHRVSFDRARILDEYHINDSRLRFLDTMSLNMAVVGEARDRKNPGVNARGQPLTAPSSSLKDLSQFHFNTDVDKEERNVFVSGELLRDIAPAVQSLITYCARDVLATYRLFSKLLPLYLHKCPHPVSFAGLLSMNSCYLPVDSSWYGYVHAAQQQYETLSGSVKGHLIALAREALQSMAVDPATDRPAYAADPWLRHLDWTAVPQRMTKEKRRKDGTVTAPARPVKRQRLPGFPAWYRKLCPTGKDTPEGLSTRTQATPLLLRLQWQGHPLQYREGFGWGYLVNEETFHRIPHKAGDEQNCGNPLSKDYVAAMETGVLSSQYPIAAQALQMNMMCSYWVGVQRRVKHQFVVLESDLKGADAYPVEEKTRRVTLVNGLPPLPALARTDKKRLGFDVVQHTVHPLCETAALLLHRALEVQQGKEEEEGEEEGEEGEKGEKGETKLEEGIENEGIEESEKKRKDILNDTTSESLNESPSNTPSSPSPSLPSLPPLPTSPPSLQAGVILPQVITAGTVTRRAVEPTWMTASNAKKTRVGSELKTKVVAPAGFKLVGADVDAEELWIAALLGDAAFRTHGATALGWQTLAGKKTEGTDMHSVTARILGASRDNAKIFNYGRIYGAGLEFSVKLLRQFNRGMSEAEARAKATALYWSTKGRRFHITQDKYGQRIELSDEDMKALPLRTRWQHYQKIEQSYWQGGSESHTFNALEAIATGKEPRTPVLGSEICEALHPRHVQRKHMTSRINWVVQSSGVDYLHLLVVTMAWLLRKYQIRARLCLTIHDEVRYLVHEEDALRAALALQISNVWTRALFVERLQMNDVPLGVAFFSAVDVDTLLRKEVTLPCVTPSQPMTLPSGEALDIYGIMERTGGHLWKGQVESSGVTVQETMPRIQASEMEALELELDVALEASVLEEEKRQSYLEQWCEGLYESEFMDEEMYEQGFKRTPLWLRRRTESAKTDTHKKRSASTKEEKEKEKEKKKDVIES